MVLQPLTSDEGALSWSTWSTDGDLGVPTVCAAWSPAVKAEKSKTNRAIDTQLQFADQELRRHTGNVLEMVSQACNSWPKKLVPAQEQFFGHTALFWRKLCAASR